MNSFFSKALIGNDPWAKWHGVVEETGFLGSAILYFAFAYMLPAKSAVILGSGSGFVPRVVRQAQREVQGSDFLRQARCILVDAGTDDKGFGMSDYHEKPDHFFRKAFADVEIWKMLTDQAAAQAKAENLQIDYLHIDADHTHEQSLKDFENFLPLMAEEFIITLHDSADDDVALSYDGCVPRTVSYLRKEMEKGGKYEHLEMINFNNRYRRESNYFQGKMRCRGVAIVKPKTLSIWDYSLTEALWQSGNTSTPNRSKSAT